jgi:hypothetical protein
MIYPGPREQLGTIHGPAEHDRTSTSKGKREHRGRLGIPTVGI